MNIIACGIFRFELEKVLPEVLAELGGAAAPGIEYLPPALDAHADKLEAAVAEKLNAHRGAPCALLYGSMCHTDWPRISEQSGARCPKPANCAELLLSPQKKKEMDAAGSNYYLTMGGLKLWKEIYQDSHGWDSVDARQNFCYFDKIVLLDTGVYEIADEELFDFFEYTQVPIEVEKITLDHFKSVVKDLLTG